MKKRIQVTICGITILKVVMRVIDEYGMVRYEGKYYPVYIEQGEYRIRIK